MKRAAKIAPAPPPIAVEEFNCQICRKPSGKIILCFDCAAAINRLDLALEELSSHDRTKAMAAGVGGANWPFGVGGAQ